MEFVLAGCYDKCVASHSIVMLVMLCVCFWVVFADYLSVDLHDYTSPVLIVHLCLYLGILNMLMYTHRSPWSISIYLVQFQRQ